MKLYKSKSGEYNFVMAYPAVESFALSSLGYLWLYKVADEKEGIILDENRFLFRMNDTNSVYVDTINIAKLNNYQRIVAALPDDVHGYIYLNSNRTNASFKAYDAPVPEDTEDDEIKEENEN